MQKPLRTTIESWLRTGLMGALKPGDTHQDVITVLGQPTATGPKGSLPIPGFWLYGIVEFGFTDAGVIKWIQVDTTNIDSELHQCEHLAIDWQGLRHNMALDACMDWLQHQQLIYSVDPDDDGVRLTVENNAQLLFCDETDPVLVTVWSPPMARR